MSNQIIICGLCDFKPSNFRLDHSQPGSQQGSIQNTLPDRYCSPVAAACGFRFVECADQAGAALKKLREWMAGAGLAVPPEKMRTKTMNVAGSHFGFLGCRLARSRQGKLRRSVRFKSLRQLRKSITSPATPGQWTKYGSHRGGFEPDPPRLVHLLHTRQNQQAELDRRLDTHEIARHPQEIHGSRGRRRRKNCPRWPNRHFWNPGFVSLCLMPKNPPVSVTEQSTDQRAGGGRSARPVLRVVGKPKPHPSLDQKEPRPPKDQKRAAWRLRPRC